MNDKDYFSHLYEIANHLNKEFSLQSALRKSLEKTVEILEVETGWIWLTEQDNKSVYLAASHNLPPALSDFPERLSGWCYCIKQYLSDDIDEAVNISEIACSRLKDIRTGTKELKFHATIPITINGEKVGIMNLLSKESRHLDDRALAILNTISELVGTAIQRTQLQQTGMYDSSKSDSKLLEVLERVFKPQLASIISDIEDSKVKDKKITEALAKVMGLKQQLSLISKEAAEHELSSKTQKEFQYPNAPLTKREEEVLRLLRKGLTNGQIGSQLFIAERTVKFHVTAILSKLNAETRTEAVDVALKRGLLGL
ncbi:MAG: LuxR C-terminal-related transcriptional regulator [Cyclobacteriaceae bacterium]